MELMPSLTPADAWSLPWDYAMDVIDAACTRADRQARADGRPNVAMAAAMPDVEPRKTDDGRVHAAGVSKMMAIFGL